MIEPTYHRDQLWARPPRRLSVAIVGAAVIGAALTFATALLARRASPTVAGHPRRAAEQLVTALAAERFPAWHARHAGCPPRLDRRSPPGPLDPWGHALHYTCDARLAAGASFAVFSAGADGVFGTGDDIEAHR